MYFDVKRFYTPKVAMKCECGEELTLCDEHTSYLSYPSTGENEVNAYCENCHAEYTAKVDLQVTCVLVKGSIVEYDG